MCGRVTPGTARAKDSLAPSTAAGVVYLADESRTRDYAGIGSVVTEVDLLALDRFHEARSFPVVVRIASAARRTDPDVPARDFTYFLVVVPAAVPTISPAVAATISAVVAIPFPVLHLVADEISATRPNQTADDSASTRRTNR